MKIVSRSRSTVARVRLIASEYLLCGQANVDNLNYCHRPQLPWPSRHSRQTFYSASAALGVCNWIATRNMKANAACTLNGWRVCVSATFKNSFKLHANACDEPVAIAKHHFFFLLVSGQKIGAECARSRYAIRPPMLNLLVGI